MKKLISSEGLSDDDKVVVLNAFVKMVRDPARWLCVGVDTSGTPQVFGLGETTVQARENAELAAVDFPTCGWRYVDYKPDREMPLPKG